MVVAIVYESSWRDLLIGPMKKVIMKVNDSHIIFPKSRDNLARSLLSSEFN